MANFPTIAIFTSWFKDQQKKKKSKTSSRRSIFDVKDTSSLHCLATVNYYRTDTNTQVLWLATTLEQPPTDSKHVMWRKIGLATYLLCMLVKQHTGIGTGTMDHSVLSLQASRQRRMPVCSFYLRLGFICHDEYFTDNGLSETSEGFQKVVKDFPQVWVPAEREAMSFFKLSQGRLNYSQTLLIDLTISDSKSVLTWKNYQYAKFPFPYSSMKRIEGYLESRPILKWLSREPLPLTDRPLSITRSMSTMSGMIIGQRRSLLNATSWLSTDEIQFLFAFCMRNPESNSGLFHVLGPSITHKISEVQSIVPKFLDGSASKEERDAFTYNVEGIQDYIDSRLDILEHKFLFFVCNVSQIHWISVVVVNPFLVSDGYLAAGKDNVNGGWGDDDFAGGVF
jgi:hypothetical protein